MYPTRTPSGKLYVDINGQSDINGTGYMKLDGSATERTIELDFDDMEPQVVTVSYNPAAVKLNITDANLIIKSVVDTTKTQDQKFKGTEQSIAPINVKLIPAKNSTKAKSITVVEPTGKTIVAEGGFTADYDIYLRPCTQPMRDDTVLSITQSVASQVGLSIDSINGNAWGNDCKVTVTVTAVDDEDQEGDHFVALGHVATNKTTGKPILLSDGSALYASNILVRIYDDDM